LKKVKKPLFKRNGLDESKKNGRKQWVCLPMNFSGFQLLNQGDLHSQLVSEAVVRFFASRILARIDKGYWIENIFPTAITFLEYCH